MKKKYYLLITVLIIASFLGGFFLSNLLNTENENKSNLFSSNSEIDNLKMEKEDLLEEIEDLKEMLPAALTDQEMEIKSFSGEVLEITNNVLKIKLSNLYNLPKDNPKIVEVNVSEDIEILKVVEKSQEKIQKQQEEFAEKSKKQIEMQKKGEEILEPVLPPDIFENIKADLSEIVVGKIIGVMTDEDIKGKSVLTATKIFLN